MSERVDSRMRAVAYSNAKSTFWMRRVSYLRSVLIIHGLQLRKGYGAGISIKDGWSSLNRVFQDE